MNGEKSLRILRIAGSIYPEVVGGIGLHVHHMSRMQAEMGHDVTVLTSDNGDRSLPRREERNRYEVIRLRELARPLDNTIAPGVLRSLQRKHDTYDIIHGHSHLFFLTNLTSIFCRFIDAPLVITNHGVYSQTAPMWLQMIFNSTIGKATFDSADQILCYTETDKERVRELGINTPVSIIHNGIDCEMFRPDSHDQEKQILFVGRLKSGKGAHRAIESFASVHKRFPEYKLKMVGDGPEKSELIVLARELGVEDNVIFAGELPNEEMVSIYNESEIFILPSDNEGLPRSVLEAMACSTPVLTSDLPQLQSIVDGAGYTVKRNARDFSEKLTQLLESSDLRAEMGERGRKMVVENFSWQDTVSMTNKVYYELINDK